MRARVRAEIARRWTRKSSTATPRSPRPPAAVRRLVPGGSLDADQAVGHRPVALEALRERHDVVHVVEVDHVAPLAGDAVDRLLVQRGALGLVADLAGLVEGGVDGLVARQRGVEAAPARLELVDVGVGVDAPAPAD